MCTDGFPSTLVRRAEVETDNMKLVKQCHLGEKKKKRKNNGKQDNLSQQHWRKGGKMVNLLCQ